MAYPTPLPKLDRYVIIHVATTCDEHGVYVAKDSAEVIELAWILLDTNTLEEVRELVCGSLVVTGWKSHSQLHVYMYANQCAYLCFFPRIIVAS